MAKVIDAYASGGKANQERKRTGGSQRREKYLGAQRLSISGEVGTKGRMLCGSRCPDAQHAVWPWLPSNLVAGPARPSDQADAISSVLHTGPEGLIGKHGYLLSRGLPKQGQFLMWLQSLLSESSPGFTWGRMRPNTEGRIQTAMIKIKARRIYICDGCHRVIVKGEEYRKGQGKVWVGSGTGLRQERLCSRC